MTAKTITYKRLFNLGNYEHEEIGIEIEVDEGEYAMDVVSKAKEFVCNQHIKTMSDIKGTGFEIAQKKIQLENLKHELSLEDGANIEEDNMPF